MIILYLSGVAGHTLCDPRSPWYCPGSNWCATMLPLLFIYYYSSYVIHLCFCYHWWLLSTICIELTCICTVSCYCGV